MISDIELFLIPLVLFFGLYELTKGKWERIIPGTRKFLEKIFAPILALPYGDKIAHAFLGVTAFIPMLTTTTYLGMGFFALFCGYVWEIFWYYVRGDKIEHLDAVAVGIGGFILALIPYSLGLVNFTW